MMGSPGGILRVVFLSGGVSTVLSMYLPSRSQVG